MNERERERLRVRIDAESRARAGVVANRKPGKRTTDSLVSRALTAAGGDPLLALDAAAAAFQRLDLKTATTRRGGRR